MTEDTLKQFEADYITDKLAGRLLNVSVEIHNLSEEEIEEWAETSEQTMFFYLQTGTGWQETQPEYIQRRMKEQQ